MEIDDEDVLLARLLAMQAGSIQLQRIFLQEVGIANTRVSRGGWLKASRFVCARRVSADDWVSSNNSVSLRRQDAASRVHRAIARLKMGDRLRYVVDDRGARIEDRDGVVVGRFSQYFTPPAGMRCQDARVRAVMVWRKLDSAPDYQARCRCEKWEVALPELVFAP